MIPADQVKPRYHPTKVTVDGEPWVPVPDLANSGPDDPHYLLCLDTEGQSQVIFGDGKHGRRPSRGSNITVTYTAEGDLSASVSLSRNQLEATPDLPLWVVIRTSSHELEFNQYEQFSEPGDEAPSKFLPSLQCVLFGVLLVLIMAIAVTLILLVRD
jgi:hypothetical protein